MFANIAQKHKKLTLFRPPFRQFSTFLYSNWRFGILVPKVTLTWYNCPAFTLNLPGRSDIIRHYMGKIHIFWTVLWNWCVAPKTLSFYYENRCFKAILRLKLTWAKNFWPTPLIDGAQKILTHPHFEGLWSSVLGWFKNFWPPYIPDPPNPVLNENSIPYLYLAKIKFSFNPKQTIFFSVLVS